MKYLLSVFLFICFGAILAIGRFYLFSANNTPSQVSVIRQSPSAKPLALKSAFSLENAPKNAIRGQIMEVSGDVLWQSRMATEPADLKSDIFIQQGEKIITGIDSMVRIKFASSSAITVQPDSEVELIQTLPVEQVFKHNQGKVWYQTFADSSVSVRSLNLILNLNASSSAEIDLDPKIDEIKITLNTGGGTVAYNSPEFESKVWQLKTKDVFYYDSVKREGYFDPDL